MTHAIAKRIGRFLERQGLLTRDAEYSYLNPNVAKDEYDPMYQLHGSSVTYRIAIGLRKGRKVFTLQTLPASDPEEWAGRVDGFSLHAGVAAKAMSREWPKKINSQGIPWVLLVEAGKVGSVECIFKGFMRFLGWLSLLDFGE